MLSVHLLEVSAAAASAARSSATPLPSRHLSARFARLVPSDTSSGAAVRLPGRPGWVKLLWPHAEPASTPPLRRPSRRGRRPPLPSRRSQDAQLDATTSDAPTDCPDGTFVLAFCDPRDAAFARAWLDASKPPRLVRDPSGSGTCDRYGDVVSGVLWLPVLKQLSTDMFPIAPNAGCRVTQVPLDELQSRAMGGDVGIAIVRPSPTDQAPTLVHDPRSARCAHWLLRVSALAPLNDYGGACRRALARLYDARP